MTDRLLAAYSRLAQPEAQVFVATYSGDPLCASWTLETHAGTHTRTHAALVQVK